MNPLKWINRFKRLQAVQTKRRKKPARVCFNGENDLNFEMKRWASQTVTAEDILEENYNLEACNPQFIYRQPADDDIVATVSQRYLGTHRKSSRRASSSLIPMKVKPYCFRGNVSISAVHKRENITGRRRPKLQKNLLRSSIKPQVQQVEFWAQQPGTPPPSGAD